MMFVQLPIGKKVYEMRYALRTLDRTDKKLSPSATQSHTAKSTLLSLELTACRLEPSSQPKFDSHFLRHL